MSINILKAEITDLSEILELQYLAYQSEARLFNTTDIPPLKQTLSELVEEHKNGCVIKAVDENNVIIGSVRTYFENETLYIGKLMVHPEHQRKGLGSKLLLYAEETNPNMRYELFTSTKSISNIKLYTKLGYKKFKTVQVSNELSFVYLEKKS